MRLYIAGPMTGYEDYNYPAFERAEKALERLGHEVVSPRIISISHGNNDWGFCLRKDIEELIHCDGIALLNGWEKSRGARLEITIGRALGHKFFTMEHDKLFPILASRIDGVCFCLPLEEPHRHVEECYSSAGCIMGGGIPS